MESRKGMSSYIMNCLQDATSLKGCILIDPKVELDMPLKGSDRDDCKERMESKRF